MLITIIKYSILYNLKIYGYKVNKINTADIITMKFFVKEKPNLEGNVLIPFFESPRISSISFIISRIKFISKANKAGTIAKDILFTETPP